MKKIIKSTIFVFLSIVFSSTVLSANGDAPGGEKVSICSDDIDVYGVLYKY